MPENSENCSDTPIFDQLAKERSYELLVSDKAYIDGWMFREVPTMNPNDKVTLEETVNPEEMEEKHGTFHFYLQDFVKRFYEKYPTAGTATLSTKEADFDSCGITVRASAVRSKPWVEEVTIEKAQEHIEQSAAFEKATRDFFRHDPLDPEVVRLKSSGVRLKKIPSPADDTDRGLIDFLKTDMLDFVRDATEKFREEHPLALVTGLKPKPNPDGTISMVIEGVEPELGKAHVKDLPGQQLELYRQAARQAWDDASPERKNEILRTPPSFTDGVYTGPKADAISPVIPVEPTSPEQTDESVNAASNIDASRPRHIPRPLWISDEEIHDEE